MSRRRLVLKGLIGTVAAVVGLVALAGIVFRNVIEPGYARFAQVKVGMTQAEVRDLLGEPYRSYNAENAPKNYFVDGYARPARTTFAEVFIYIAKEPIAYVYFDSQGQVEEVFIGGS